ncbi:MAG: hypothetical protein AAF922_19620 [Pseudomonadota bacterium]
MSFVRMARVAIFSGLVGGIAAAGFPFPGKASAEMPTGYLSLAQDERLAAPASSLVRISQNGVSKPLIAARYIETPSPLPLAGWLLGAVLIGLTAFEFRRAKVTWL